MFSFKEFLKLSSAYVSTDVILNNLNHFLLQGKDGPAGAFGPQGYKGDKVRYHNQADYRSTALILVTYGCVCIPTGG